MNYKGYHVPVDIRTGSLRQYSIDSVQAFWPGLEVLVGDISLAINSHYKFWQIWDE